LKPFSRIPNPRDIRRKLDINQMDFWSQIGVTQSGGSRYESGRSMPKPVRELLRLVYIKNVPLANASGTDLRIAALLRERKPALYNELRAAASKKA
jgi:predicted transcriptional regulator